MAHRCPRCRGIWLDPASFQRLCEEEARAPDEETALAPRASPAAARASRREEKIRYRPCAACGEVMGRANFGRVSGILIDVCRPHGAWCDRGELAAIRSFLRSGGARRYERHQRLAEEEERRGEARRGSAPWAGASADPFDLIFGGGAFDVPSRIPMLPLAIGLAVIGASALWSAWQIGDGYRIRAPIGVALSSLYLAYRAFTRWLDRRRA